MVSEKSVGGLIFVEEDKKRKYLLLEYERINDEKGQHKYWDFPKGHVEKDEKETDTLFREIKEETGLENIDLVLGFKEKLKYFFKKDGKLIAKEVIYYLLKSNSKEVKISFEHTGFKWIEYDQALKQIEFKSSKDILKKAEKFINSSLMNYE
ncbi:MAG: NUDIX domain-containing protein [Nanoarchaeota archaeon]